MEELEIRLFKEPLAALLGRLSYSARLTRLAEVLQDSYDEPSFCLDEAARASGLEKNHLNVLLRSAIGFTFHQLLLRFRLRRAARLLESTNLTVLEVSGRSGFGSLSSLERNFARAFGCPPRDFRKLNASWKKPRGERSQRVSSRHDVATSTEPSLPESATYGHAAGPPGRPD